MGLILCSEKDEALAQYALEGLSNNVMSAEYRTASPCPARNSSQRSLTGLGRRWSCEVLRRHSDGLIGERVAGRLGKLCKKRNPRLLAEGDPLKGYESYNTR